MASEAELRQELERLKKRAEALLESDKPRTNHEKGKLRAMVNGKPPTAADLSHVVSYNRRYIERLEKR